MRRHPFVVIAAIGTVALVGSLARAQSLGDVARKEEARRKTVTAGKVYTDDNLHADGAQPAAAPPATADKPASSAKPAGDAPPAAPAAENTKKDEKYWRTRITAERDALSRAETFAEALQSRINGLTADFAARDDPSQRTKVGADRQKALDELDRVRKEITAHNKAINDIQDEARKAGVPAGWLR